MREPAECKTIVDEVIEILHKYNVTVGEIEEYRMYNNRFLSETAVIGSKLTENQ